MLPSIPAPRRASLCLVGSLLLLAACSGEAGSTIDGTDAGFGSAVNANMQIAANEQGYVIDLTRRFAASVPPTVNFAFNSAALDAQAQAILRQQANFIRQFPELRFRVYGYTDLVGSNAYNKALGMRRAQAVVAFLSSQGISRSRLEAVISYGKTRPLVVTQAPNEQNRRAVTEVSGFVKGGNGQVLNGKYAEVIMREYVSSATQVHNVSLIGSVTSVSGGSSGSGGN